MRQVNFPAICIHSAMTQDERSKNFNAFRSGQVRPESRAAWCSSDGVLGPGRVTGAHDCVLAANCLVIGAS